MSANSSDKPTKPDAPKFAPAKQKKQGTHKWWLIFSLPAWVLFGFLFAQVVLGGVLSILVRLGVPFDGINESVLNATFAACVYLLSFAIVIGLPWIIKKRRTTKQELGLQRLPSWMDIGLAPAALIVYFLASGIAIYLATQFLPSFNATEPQEVGFDNLNRQYEYLLAFATLVIIAPIAEEVLFRGYLYGKLRKSVPIWAAMIVVSLLFGALHMQWNDGFLAGLNVGIDVFVLSIVMCSLREVTGSIWAGILLHMMKNGLAFYFLFINPVLLNTIGG